MGLFRAFFKGLTGDSPQKFFAEIMNSYFNAIGRGYTHKESMTYVIQSRYPHSDLKQKWIEKRLRLFPCDSNEDDLKELVFAIWLLEIGPKSNPGDVESFCVTRINAKLDNDPIWSKLCSDIDEVYDSLLSSNGKKGN
ncbi:MAG: hypothetical protein ABSC55_12585 [Syntrophorhabdales bacterium]